MAEGGPSPELDVHLLECPICLERLQQPKSLPCLHCFCQECLGTYITKELSGKTVSATSFPCPVCRRMAQPANQTEAKDKWAEQFPTNVVIQDLIQLRECSSEPLYCKPCQTKGDLTNLAKFWCKMMNLNLCETCKVQHHDVLHNDCDILDITRYDSRKTKQKQSVPKCDQHDEILIWYCEDHKRLGCNICMIKDHRRCDEVTTAMEYLQKIKAGSQLEEMEMALKKGAQAMTSLVKDFDEQIQTMVQNQEIALQSIKDLRQSVEEQLNKVQRDVTDKLIALFKEEKGNMEASSRQCERLMNSMVNTMKSSVTATEENNTIEAIVLYQRGQAEVESCKALVTEMSTSFMSVSIRHHIVPRLVTLGDEAMGKVVIERQRRCLPGDLDYLSVPLSERRVKEIGKLNVKTTSDKNTCWICGVVYLPNEQIVLSDSNNRKLKLFTDKGQYLDELTIRGYPWDLCLVNNNTVAVAVYSPGGVRVVKVEGSKLSLSSEINMPNGKDCYGITHTDGRFIVGTDVGEVYSVTQDGVTEFLHKYNSNCWSLSQDPVKGDTIVSVSNTITGDVAVSRLSADKRHMDVMKVGVVSDARGIDLDREGNIYVCGNSLHNVVQMSGDGTHVRELLTSSEGMDSPRAIAVGGDKILVTSNSTGQRFRFCGDLDCPDWVLAEISILARMTSVKMKLLCIQVIKDLLDEGIDYEKVYKLTSDAKFEMGDVKASLAALSFVLSSAAKYGIDGESLSNELQQLGLPKEHTAALCKSYSDGLDKLQTHFRRKSLRLSHVDAVRWRVDYVLSSSELKDVNTPCVQLQLTTKDPDTGATSPVSFTVSMEKFRVLLNELKQANTIVESLSS